MNPRSVPLFAVSKVTADPFREDKAIQPFLNKMIMQPMKYLRSQVQLMSYKVIIQRVLKKNNCKECAVCAFNSILNIKPTCSVLSLIEFR